MTMETQGPGELTDQQKMAGESYGWLITRGEDDTPAGLTDAFKKKNIPLGNKNVKRYAEQEIPFKNCHGDQQVSSVSQSYTISVAQRLD